MTTRTITTKEDYLKNSRKQREEALKGKFVITQNSRFEPGVVLYLQDRDLASAQGNKANWTKFLANAKGFDNQYAADAVARRYKYNNVTVREVY